MFKKTAGTFAVKLVVAIINLAVAILLSRVIGAQGKGEASLITAGIAMLLLFCNMIGGASLVYLVPRYNIFQLAAISNLWSLVVCAVSYFILSQSTILPPEFVLHVCILSLINSFISTNLSILLGKERIGGNNLVLLIQAIMQFSILLVLLLSMGQKDTSSYVISLYAATLLCLLLSTFMVFPYIIGISFSGSRKITGELARLGFTNQLGHIMSFASFRVSYFLLNKYCLASGVGVYSNGVSLVESLFLITNSIATVQYATIANSDDKLFSQELTVRLTRLSTLLLMMAMIPLLLLPGSFYIWLFGNEFHGVRNVILMLSPGILFYNAALITGHYFSGTGKYKVNTMGNLAGLIVTLTLSGIFISSYTITVAALISTTAYVATTLTVLLYFKREANVALAQLLPGFSDLTWGIQRAKAFFKAKV